MNSKNRKSLRLKIYDYTQNGAYFITICTQNKAYLFGDIVDDKMQLNMAGEMVQSVWNEIPIYYSGIEIDVFQIMPNHIHGIILLEKGRVNTSSKTGQPQGVAPTCSLSKVVHGFKTLTTRKYIEGVKKYNWPKFDKKIWQRNYYEHIIRNDESLDQTRV